MIPPNGNGGSAVPNAIPPQELAGTVQIDLAQRVIIMPVKGGLDVIPRYVRLPFHVFKGLTAQIMLAEANAEQSREQPKPKIVRPG